MSNIEIPSLESAVQMTLIKYEKEVEAYKKGKIGVIGLFAGEVMKIGLGRYEPTEVVHALRRELEPPLPNSLDEAINLLVKANEHSVEEIKKNTEKEFIGRAHNTLGRNLRNGWQLWWQPQPEKGWSVEKPKLVEYFNNLGIYHADDMSGIILTCFYRYLTGAAYDVPAQVAHYIQFWKDQGFENGIPNQEEKK